MCLGEGGSWVLAGDNEKWYPELGSDGDKGEKLVSSARAAPGERGKPVGTEERNDLMMSWSAWVSVRWWTGAAPEPDCC